MLGSERIDLFLEAIQRQPHSRLERERRWQPSTSADSKLFMRDPLRFGRDWRAAESPNRGMAKGFNAGEILEERQFETFDTPPNQFVKFALRQFHSLCDEIVALLDSGTGSCLAGGAANAGIARCVVGTALLRRSWGIGTDAV